MRDFSEEIADLRRRVDDARAYLRVADAAARVEELEREASRPDLWDDPGAARAVTSELARCRDDLDVVAGLDGKLSDVETLHELAREEDDAALEPEIEQGVTALAAELASLELRALFTGEHDERDDVANTPVRVDKTPGRNEPCSCGSGKKYKLCHGR